MLTSSEKAVESGEHIFSTQISYETRSLRMPSAPDPTSNTRNCIVTSCLYGYLIVGVNNTLLFTEIEDLETATENFQASQTCLLQENVLGVSISADELLVLAYTSKAIYLYRISDINSGKCTSYATIPIASSMSLCQWSKHRASLLLFTLDTTGTISIYNDQGKLLATESYPKCVYADWSPNNDSIALVQGTKLIILSANLQVLQTFSPELPSDLIAFFNYILWIPPSTAAHSVFLLGCQCSVPSEDDGSEDKFVSLMVTSTAQLGPLRQLAYFEDVCQDLQQLSADQTFFTAYLRAT